MSFSNEVKKELLDKSLSPCCERAQSCALLLFGREFSEHRLSFFTREEETAYMYCRAVCYFSGKTVIPEKTQGGKYKVTTENKQITSAVYKQISDFIAKKETALSKSCCRASFLRGAFFACGSVTNPEKEYHLEFDISEKKLCAYVSELFDGSNTAPKTIFRAGSYVIYLKNSSDIEDILTFMGAPESAMKFMSAKVVKDIRNHVNRRVNFENANLSRTIASASRQYEAIAYIKSKTGLEALPENLREAARLRYENRELSAAELARLLSEKLSASGMNHRLKKLIDIAEDMKK